MNATSFYSVSDTLQNTTSSMRNSETLLSRKSHLKKTNYMNRLFRICTLTSQRPVIRLGHNDVCDLDSTDLFISIVQ